MPSTEDDRLSETERGFDEGGSDDESFSDGTDPDEDGEPQQFKPELRVEQRLEQVVRLMRDDKKQWKDITEVDKRGLIGRTTHSSGPTALHILADEKPLGKDESPVLKDLVEYLVKSDQDLLLQVDDNSGYTPLHLAIYRRNRSMVKWICAACDDIDAVLRKKGTKLKRNCIHLAIESARSGKDKTARSLVDLASAETLADKDEEGNTPLALAVEYNRCKEGQLNLIETIVERSDYYIRERPENDFNNAHQSPYMYHLATADAAKPKFAPAEPIAVPDQRPRRPEPGTRPEPSTRPLVPKANVAASMTNPLSSRPGDAMGKAGIGPLGKHGPEKIQPPDPGALSKPASDANVSHANEIRKFLKKHYLRSRDQDAALEILYGRNPISG